MNETLSTTQGVEIVLFEEAIRNSILYGIASCRLWAWARANTAFSSTVTNYILTGIN